MSWSEAGNAEGTTEEILLAKGLQVSDVGHETPGPKRGYVELRQSLTVGVKSRRIECEATTCKLCDCEAKARRAGVEGLVDDGQDWEDWRVAEAIRRRSG